MPSLCPAFRSFARRFACAALAVACQGWSAASAQDAQTVDGLNELEQRFTNPPASARPWTFWYWLKGAISAEGIEADIKAMAEAGLGGAYLMPLIAPDPEPFWSPPVETLSAEYWALLKRAVEAAERVGLSLGLHIGPGFSLAGGPWITPELAMQRLVWSEIMIDASDAGPHALPPPPDHDGFYKDVAVFAIPVGEATEADAESYAPAIEASFEADFSELADRAAVDAPTVRLYEAGSITYTYPQPVRVGALLVVPATRSHEALRLRIESSDDGKQFRVLRQLEPPRHGWQDEAFGFTYSLPATVARHIRFVYDPEGSEPGAEDLDRAKWKPSLKVKTLALSSVPRIDQFEGKSAAVWRVAPWTNPADIPADSVVARSAIVDISSHLGADGTLRWTPPAGRWRVLRMGHSPTGATNYTGGAGEGLEADRFNSEAIELQFDRWFAESERQLGAELFQKVVTTLHSDSWEAGSQNWGATFRQDFMDRRGYDPLPWLPAMAGYVIDSVEDSERFLHDVRQTVAELVNERYFGTLQRLAKERGCQFSSESVAPTMVSDNLRHHGSVDLPMGEFWLRSPTHDKPMDMRDAVSGGHIYGKQIIQAEAFTQLRIAWDEAPHNLRALGDLHFALGVNRFVFHVFMQNPWVGKAPGVSLNGVGLFFQRDQTWWRQGKAWIDYITCSQALLQAGKPVVDIAVFAGEELPSRGVPPDRLTSVLPGLIGPEILAKEAERLADRGNPTRQMPKGVTASRHLTDLSDWSDPLNGYDYDSVNLDVLRSAIVEDAQLVLAAGVRYRVLVIPGHRRLNPEGGERMSTELAGRLLEFARQGLPIVLQAQPISVWSRQDDADQLKEIGTQLVAERSVHLGAWRQATLTTLGAAPELALRESDGSRARSVAWTRRAIGGARLYFVSNQLEQERQLELAFGQPWKGAEVWDAVTGQRRAIALRESSDGHPRIQLDLAVHQSLFVVLSDAAAENVLAATRGPVASIPLQGDWTVRFPSTSATMVLPADKLVSWSNSADPEIAHFSGTARYECSLAIPPERAGQPLRLRLGRVADIAEVFIDNVSLGVVWTTPWELAIPGGLSSGSHALRIEVTNTWANQLIADHGRDEGAKRLWTNAPYRLDDEPLLEAGLLGPVELLVEKTR